MKKKAELWLNKIETGSWSFHLAVYKQSFKQIENREITVLINQY